MRLKHRLTTLDARVAAKRSLHLADERAEASALRWAIDKIEEARGGYTRLVAALRDLTNEALETGYTSHSVDNASDLLKELESK